MAYGARSVPQNIMKVEFKIFELLTLKQFGVSIALLIGCFILFLILPSPWGIIVTIVTVLSGAVIIFVPFNGEPFQEFVSNYLEAMISPQRRIWHKKGIILTEAVEKAKLYQYGNTPNQNDNKFLFPDKNSINLSGNESKLDSDENNFMTSQPKTSENKYTPPGLNKQIAQQNLQQISRPINPNSVNLNMFPKKQNSQSQINTTQSNVENKLPTEPAFIKKEFPQAGIENINDYEKEKTAIKNFLFGNVEDDHGKPVRGASINLLDYTGSKLIETIYTDDNGDFKTAYEYTEGIYYINVSTASNKDFNTIPVKHEPVDPSPIIIYPKGFDPSKPIIKQEEKPAVSDDGIFTGNYDSNAFSIGENYNDKHNQISDNSSATTQQAIQDTNIADKTRENLEQSLSESSAGDNTIDRPKYIKSENTQPFNESSNSNQSSQDIQHSNVKIYDWNLLINATIPLDDNLVTIPNTINGVILSTGNRGIANILIRILDNLGVLVLSVYSDPSGRFYSYSPLPSGAYTVFMVKENVNLVGFKITLNGTIIPPKQINFT